MSLAVWDFPTKILFGEGSIDEVGREAKRLGGTYALLITDAGVAATGIVDAVGRTLKQAELTYSTFEGVSTNPTEAQARKGTEAFAAAKADVIVAVGGGSVIDVGKLVRLMAAHRGPLSDYDDAKGGSEKITEPMAPLIAIPTTSGTGSEVGRSAVATLASTHAKTVFFSPRLIPNVAILDPSVTVTLPAKGTAATGFDALTHNIEAYAAKGEHPMADGIALYAVEIIAQYLHTAVQSPEDLEARGAMQKAAMMGAVAFQKGLGACHALAHPLSAEFNVHHGVANAICLPAVLDFNRKAVPARIARLARILGARGESEETLAFECSGAVRKLRKSIGLPEGLTEVGIEEAAIPHLAELAYADNSHRSNPRSCTVDDFVALYQASL
ncbi:MAG: iron-containing alcohol dehydrogenase [Myxococcales bacterium]|nr:iron-containing alcohol dehydrogenase [Myxococcales bacterium]